MIKSPRPKESKHTAQTAKAHVASFTSRAPARPLRPPPHRRLRTAAAMAAAAAAADEGRLQEAQATLRAAAAGVRASRTAAEAGGAELAGQLEAAVGRTRTRAEYEAGGAAWVSQPARSHCVDGHIVD